MITLGKKDVITTLKAGYDLHYEGTKKVVTRLITEAIKDTRNYTIYKYQENQFESVAAIDAGNLNLEIDVRFFAQIPLDTQRISVTIFQLHAWQLTNDLDFVVIPYYMSNDKLIVAGIQLSKNIRYLGQEAQDFLDAFNPDQSMKINPNVRAVKV